MYVFYCVFPKLQNGVRPSTTMILQDTTMERSKIEEQWKASIANFV